MIYIRTPLDIESISVQNLNQISEVVFKLNSNTHTHKHTYIQTPSKSYLYRSLAERPGVARKINSYRIKDHKKSYWGIFRWFTTYNNGCAIPINIFSFSSRTLLFIIVWLPRQCRVSYLLYRIGKSLYILLTVIMGLLFPYTWFFICINSIILANVIITRARPGIP